MKTSLQIVACFIFFVFQIAKASPEPRHGSLVLFSTTKSNSQIQQNKIPTHVSTDSPINAATCCDSNWFKQVKSISYELTKTCGDGVVAVPCCAYGCMFPWNLYSLLFVTSSAVFVLLVVVRPKWDTWKTATQHLRKSMPMMKASSLRDDPSGTCLILEESRSALRPGSQR